MSRACLGLACAALLAAGCATTPEPEKPRRERMIDQSVLTAGADGGVNIFGADSPLTQLKVRPLQTVAPLSVVLQPVENKPIVSLRVVFRAGSVDDPKGKEGLTALTTRLLAEGGTRALSSAELIQALFPIAAELNAGADKEFTTFEGRVHKDNLGKFFPIFTDVLLNPRFDPSEFERLKSDALNHIRNDLRSQNDEHLGKVMLDALLYRGHPYQHYPQGTIQGLSSITLDDVKAHARRVFTQDRAVLGLAGGVDQALADKLKGALAALPPTGAPLVSIPPPLPLRGQALVIQKDGLSTAISMGYPWELRRGDPDYFKVALALSDLGEHRQFNGVLFQELREKRGLNYGDYAYVEHFHQEGWGTFPMVNVGRTLQDFSIWIRPVEPQNAVFAARSALYFLDRLAKEGIPEQRFQVTRGFLTGYTRLWEQTDQRRLGYAIDALFYGTPEFLESFRKAMAEMTAAQVSEAAARHLSRDKVNLVFVAKDAEGLEKLLAEQPPTPIQYATPKTEEVLALDAKLVSAPLPVKPDRIEVLPAGSVMEK